LIYIKVWIISCKCFERVYKKKVLRVCILMTIAISLPVTHSYHY